MSDGRLRTVVGATAFVSNRLEKITMNAVSSRAKRSVVEGSREQIYGNATGFLDFARNDEEKSS
jgi:hypothetical protein